MGIKIKGVSKTKRRLDAIVGDIHGRRVVRALQSALIIGGTQAAIYTPIDTSTLINSQFREIVTDGVIVTGRVGYSANYAVYVHDPAIPQNFRRATAKKEFLTAGFEETRSQIDAAVKKEMSL